MNLASEPLVLGAVRLFVHDLAAALAFYRHTLGLRLVVDQSSLGWCLFLSGGVRIVLEQVPPDAPEDEQVLAGRFTGLSFTVADIQAQHVRLRDQGVYFSGAPELQAWGGWIATFEDTAGNTLQLVQYPAQAA